MEGRAMRRFVQSGGAPLVLLVAVAWAFGPHPAAEEAHPGNKVLFHEPLERLPPAEYKLGVWISRWKPGEVTPLHFHHGPGVLCVQEGELKIHIPSRGETVSLKPDQCWKEVPGMAHRPSNPGRHAAVAVFVLIHPADKPLRMDLE
jgi:mannose-6-phosphate isomerase-like protein (cupin superfamily)